MSSAKTILLLALGGLAIGLLLGAIAAGAYATWITGGDAANVGFTTIFRFFPETTSAITTTEPIRTALMIWGGIALVVAIAVPVIGVKRQLTSHGSARWATNSEMKKAGLLTQLKGLNGPIYGKAGKPKSRADFLSSREIPHSLVSAPTGSGKTRSVVIPTLLTYPGSILCLDLKGELFAKTSRRRVSFGDTVYKFSPYAEDNRTHRYNPLQDVADTHSRRRFTEARRLAASFIIAHGSGEGFLEGARDIFAATAMLVVERKTPTIGAVFDALSQPGDAFATLRKLGDEVVSPEAKKIFYKMGGMEARILSSYLSVLSDGGLSLWADPAVRDATAASDFSIRTLRSQPASIYLVVSPNDLEPLAPLIRLMFQQTIAIMQRSEPDLEKGEKYTVLFCLDEFPALGRMDTMVSAIATLRSYGGRIMIVVQTIASLEIYGKDGAAVILGNCRMQLFMAPADKETPAYISSAIGDFTRSSRSKSWKGGELTTSYQERAEGAPLIRPEQLRMLDEDYMVALVQGSYPIRINKVYYDQDRVLKPLFVNQTGPYPDPPEIPDEPLVVPQDPVAPTPTQGGAANPITAHRTTADVAAKKATPSAPETGNGAEPATDIAGDATAPETQEERQVRTVQGKWRGIRMATSAALEIYREGTTDDDQPGAPEISDGDAEAAEETDVKGSADASRARGADASRARGLTKSALAEAQSKQSESDADTRDASDS